MPLLPGRTACLTLGCSRTYEGSSWVLSVCLGSVDAFVMAQCLGDITRWAGHLERVSWDGHLL